MNFKVYIPARYASTRLPGKVLLEWRGKPLVQHVYERAVESGAAEVVIATDDERVAVAARGFGATVAMTAAQLASGTDRVAAAAGDEDPAQILVNVQGDEPLMPPAVIRQVAETLAAGQCEIATVCEALSEDQVFDPNVVKVVRDRECRALYFSRASIPWHRDGFADGTFLHGAAVALERYRRHVGIYAYRKSYLDRFVALPVSSYERLEALEQLRALDDGACIMVPDALDDCGRGIDTAADLEALRATPGRE